jgi:hypothetical protein
MLVEVLNKGSYGGEMIMLTDVPQEFWDELKTNGIRCRSNEYVKWFMSIDLASCENRRLKQELIDLIEDTGYSIMHSVEKATTINFKPRVVHPQLIK